MTAAATLTPTLTGHRSTKTSRHSPAAACGPTLVFKEKAAQFNADAEIQALLAEINADDGSYAYLTEGYSSAAAERLKATDFDRIALGARDLPYERLDQLTFDLLLGVR